MAAKVVANAATALSTAITVSVKVFFFVVADDVIDGKIYILGYHSYLRTKKVTHSLVILSVLIKSIKHKKKRKI